MLSNTHTVYYADNNNMHLLEDESVHLVVTSPPYVTTEFKKGQAFEYDLFLDAFSSVCSSLFKVLVPGGRFALNVADVITKYRYKDSSLMARAPLGSDLLQVAQNSGFRFLERYIWDKGYTRNFGGPLLGSFPFPLTVYNNNYFEYIYILYKPGKRTVKQSVRKSSEFSLEEWRIWTQQWWRVESITEKFDYHRAVFPIEIPYRIIRMYSYVGDTILDPYLGSGATMIASYLTNRSSIGFEIESCDDIVKHRIEYEKKYHHLSGFKYKTITI
ncbi:DNA methylase N-4/N-6 domain protein [Magnetococcus marinus MC-1]|uniref:Methyltransferase n=1 Tax=Magnetococcus marinus (strain ATCC BAA-1437 / JCM 17883 / MC-1) TaxID=156889 RepID=A0L750_MAGMM|nr:site-specific DNA-methyltransferase [Magnetococcus marinus]ABK43793.1 DNA methylase N-4/N-6 domain protein [Magnetococcus marinus MC-1]